MLYFLFPKLVNNSPAYFLQHLVQAVLGLMSQLVS